MTVTGGRPITLDKHKNICAEVIIFFKYKIHRNLETI